MVYKTLKRLFRTGIELSWRLRNEIAESTRALTMLVVLKPAADYLPARRARAVAELIGLLRDVSPLGSRSIRPLMKRTFHFSDERAMRTARQWLATRYCDFVALRRIVRGREDPTNWRVVEMNAEGVRSLRESGASYIVATGHFSRDPQIALFMPAATPGRILAVYGAKPPQGFSPHAVRGRTELGQMLECIRQVHEGNVEFFFIGHGTISDLVQHLRQHGSVAVVHVDPVWQRKRRRYDRPFAGHRLYPVSTGTATLARLAQCPIATCIPFVADDGTVVLEWGTIIPPPAPTDENADIRITNELLDRFERAVGLRPAQYVLPIGGERQWNAATSRWEEGASTPVRVDRQSRASCNQASLPSTKCSEPQPRAIPVPDSVVQL